MSSFPQGFSDSDSDSDGTGFHVKVDPDNDNDSYYGDGDSASDVDMTAALEAETETEDVTAAHESETETEDMATAYESEIETEDVATVYESETETEDVTMLDATPPASPPALLNTSPTASPTAAPPAEPEDIDMPHDQLPTAPDESGVASASRTFSINELDVDYTKIVGPPALLPFLTKLNFTVGTLLRNEDDLLLVAYRPGYVYVDKDFKDAIIVELIKHFGYNLAPSGDSRVLLRWVKRRISSHNLAAIFVTIGVRTVTYVDYAMKGKLSGYEWVDDIPREWHCKIVLDVGAVEPV